MFVFSLLEKNLEALISYIFVKSNCRIYKKPLNIVNVKRKRGKKLNSHNKSGVYLNKIQFFLKNIEGE
ncbi:MAG: hypothetical protein DWQ02_01455 [Bacteroidetes bacterium]|nr:MAG: hypothetical protein DWQ02_01455 [Bacteroidota bacterium]